MNSRRNNGKDMGLGSSGKDDNTPFDGSGLKLKSVKTRRELNEVEFDSILRVTEKYLLSKPSRKIAPFNFDWLLGLHREMLGSIWSWAGEIRATEKNIGVSPKIIAAELGSIAMEPHSSSHSKTYLFETCCPERNGFVNYEKSRRWSCGLASALFGYPAVGVNRSGEFKLWATGGFQTLVEF